MMSLKALDVQLLEAGHSVVATCRKPQQAGALNELANTYTDRLIIVPLDVNDEASIQVCTAPSVKICPQTISVHQGQLCLPNLCFNSERKCNAPLCPSLQPM